MKPSFFPFWFIFLLLVSCNMPTGSSDKVEWAVEYSLPVGKMTYFMKDLFGKMKKGPITVGSTSDSGTLFDDDTISITFSSKDTAQNSFVLANPATFNKTFSLEKVLTRGLQPLTASFSIPQSNISRSSIVTLLDTIIATDFKMLKFVGDKDSALLTIKNTTTETMFEDCSIRLGDGSKFKEIASILKPLKPGESMVLPVSLAELLLKDTTIIQAVTSISKPVVSKIIEGLLVSLDLNGSSLLEGIIRDINITVPFYYTGEIPLVHDDFVLRFADINRLNVNFSLTNTISSDFDIDVEFPGIIDRNYARKNSIISADMIPSDVGSANTQGHQKIHLEPNQNNFKIGLNSVRILSRWKEGANLSTLPFIMNGTLRTKGAMISVENLRKCSMTTSNVQVDLNELYGHFKNEFRSEGKRKKLSLPISNTNGIMTEFRDKLKLTQNDLALNLEYFIPDSSSISAMNYWCIMEMYCGKEIRFDTLDWKASEIQKGKKCAEKFIFNKVVNSLPDSIFYRINYSFPKNSVIDFKDSLFIRVDQKCRASLPVSFDLQLQSQLVWSVNDTICVDLGIKKFPLKFEKTWKEPMNEKSLGLNYEITNQTNLTGTVLGLAGTKSQQTFLEKISKEDALNFCETGNFPAGIIPILGNKGTSVPKRNSMSKNDVQIESKELENIISSDSLFIRLFLKANPSEEDALKNGDYISLDAGLTLKGIQSTDILNLK